MALVGMSEAVEQPAIIYKGKKPYKMIGVYLMGDVIGEGAQGKVREALHSETLRRMAIKIVNMRSIRRTKQGEEALRDEISIHRKLKHPNIVELIEEFLIPEKDKWYIVLEFVAGATLQDFCDVQPGRTLPGAVPQHLMRQLLMALDYCHGRGVVHRDIKPQNMLVDAYGNLKLCDFGVAVKLSAYGSDVCSKTRGSPAFQPPEVASGSDSFSGFKVDVWAAGVSLYILVTGAVPFEGSSLIQLFEKIAAGAYSVPPCIAEKPQLLSLLRALMEVDQEKRLTVSEALCHPWLTEGFDSSSQAAWGDQERATVLALASRGARTSAVLRSIARKYGEELPPDPPAAEDAGGGGCGDRMSGSCNGAGITPAPACAAQRTGSSCGSTLSSGHMSNTPPDAFAPATNHRGTPDGVSSATDSGKMGGRFLIGRPTTGNHAAPPAATVAASPAAAVSAAAAAVPTAAAALTAAAASAPPTAAPLRVPRSLASLFTPPSPSQPHSSQLHSSHPQLPHSATPPVAAPPPRPVAIPPAAAPSRVHGGQADRASGRWSAALAGVGIGGKGGSPGTAAEDSKPAGSEAPLAAGGGGAASGTGNQGRGAAGTHEKEDCVVC